MKSLLHKLGLVSLTGLALAGGATDEAASSEEASGTKNGSRKI